MKWNKKMIFFIILFLGVAFIERDTPHLLLLSIAQMVYIPFILHMIIDENTWLYRYLSFIVTPVMISIFILHFTAPTIWDNLFAIIYVLFTFIIALYGIGRFLKRGFTHIEEFMLDIACINLAVGGMWFFAYIGNIDTGFSHMITWLTAIHFHYAAFLLPVFTGLLGRIAKPRFYRIAAVIVCIAPYILAIGITFSAWIEWFSVILYILGIYLLILISSRTAFKNKWQKLFIILSFSTLGATILLSFLYAFGHVINVNILSIPFMLQSHGLLNSVFFALGGLIGWAIYKPPMRFISPTFPISKIKGKAIIGEKILPSIKVNHSVDSLPGLVDDFTIYESDITVHTLAPTIRDFYEDTANYRLFAKVKWNLFFKPFIAIYRLISSFTQQINLPLSSKQIEMTGDIIQIKAALDGRPRPRAWVRKMKDEVIFVALYSWHRSKEHTYMNISLPLPFSSMIGILGVKQIGSDLELSSKKVEETSEAGIYLSWGKFLFKLPIEETFYVREIENGKLQAHHKMWIFSIPFLQISYDIEKLR